MNIPGDVKSEMGDLLRSLAKGETAIHWVKPEILHITLHFLGNLGDEQIGRAKLAMQSLAGKFKGFRFGMKKISGFPSNKRPRVIFLECGQTNGNSVFKFQKLLGEKLAQNGISVDTRSWRPHITLGRVKTPGGEPFDFSAPAPRIDSAFDVVTYDLMESTLNRDGPEYTILEKFNLIPDA